MQVSIVGALADRYLDVVGIWEFIWNSNFEVLRPKENLGREKWAETNEHSNQAGRQAIRFQWNAKREFSRILPTVRSHGFDEPTLASCAVFSEKLRRKQLRLIFLSQISIQFQIKFVLLQLKFLVVDNKTLKWERRVACVRKPETIYQIALITSEQDPYCVEN